MKKFYKNKKILIAMTSLMLCFNLCSKTMAMDLEKIGASEFSQQINNLKENFLNKKRKFEALDDKTGLNNNKKSKKDEPIKNLTYSTTQNNTSDLPNKIIDFYKSDNVVNKINSIVDKTKQANVTSLGEKTKDLIKQINDFANKTKQANITDLDEETKDLIKQINDFADKTKQANTTAVNTEKNNKQNKATSTNKIIYSDESYDEQDNKSIDTISKLENKTTSLIDKEHNTESDLQSQYDKTGLDNIKKSKKDELFSKNLTYNTTQNNTTDLPNKINNLYKSDNVVNKINSIVDKTKQANITNLDEEPKDLIKQINDFADKTKQANTTAVNTEKNKQNKITNLPNKIIDSNEGYDSDDSYDSDENYDKQDDALIEPIFKDYSNEQKAKTNLTNKKRKLNKNRSKKLNLINEKLESLKLIYLIEDLFSDDLIMSTETIPISPDIRAKLEEIHENVYIHEPFDNDRCDKYEHFFTNCIESLNKILNKDVQISRDYFDIFLKPLCIFKEKTKNEDEVINNLYALNKIINVLEPSSETKPIFEKTLNKMLKNSSKKIILKNNVKPSFDNLNIKIKYDKLDNNNNEIVEDNNNLINLNKKTYTDEELNLPRKRRIRLYVNYNKNFPKKINYLNIDDKDLNLLRNIHSITREYAAENGPFSSDKNKQYLKFRKKIVEYLQKNMRNYGRYKRYNNNKRFSTYFDKFLKPLFNFQKQNDEKLILKETENKNNSNDEKLILKETENKNNNNDEKLILKETENKNNNNDEKLILKETENKNNNNDEKLISRKRKNKNNNIDKKRISRKRKSKNNNFDDKFNKKFCYKILKTKQNKNNNIKNNNINNFYEKKYEKFTDRELFLPAVGVTILNVKPLKTYTNLSSQLTYLIITKDMIKDLRAVHGLVLEQSLEKEPFKEDDPTKNKKYYQLVENAMYYLKKFFSKRNVCIAYFLKFLKPLLNFKNDPTDKELNLPSEETIKLFLNQLNVNRNIDQNEDNKINEDYIKEIKNKLRIVYKIIFKDKKFVSKNSIIYIDFKKYIINILNSIFKNITVANNYYYKFIKPLLLFWFDVETNPENIKINTPDEDIALNMPAGLKMNDDVRAELRSIHENVNNHDQFFSKENERYFLKTNIMQNLTPIFNGDLELSKKYLIEYLNPMIQNKSAYNEELNSPDVADTPSDEELNLLDIDNIPSDEELNLLNIDNIPSNEELNLPNTGKITLKIKSSKNKKATTTEKTIELSPETITQLRKVHNFVHLNDLFSIKNYKNYKFYRDYIIQKILKPIFNSYEVAKAYYKEYIKSFFKNNKNTINFVETSDEDQNNNIVDISENFDEEHFNRLLNLPNLGTLELLVKPDNLKNTKKAIPTIINIDEKNIEPLKKIHIEAFIESSKIKITGYEKFKNHICYFLTKIFKQRNVAVAYFKKFIEPLLNKEQQNNNNIINIDENFDE